MFDVAVDDEAVSFADVEGLACDVDVERAADDVDELMVRVAVASADPALLEEVAHEHELIGVGEDLTDHSGFWGEAPGVLILDDAHIGSYLR